MNGTANTDSRTWVGRRTDYLVAALGMSRRAAGEQARRELANASRRGIDLAAKGA